MGFKIKHIDIPELDIYYTVGQKNVVNIVEWFRTISRDGERRFSSKCEKLVYIVNVEKDGKKEYVEIASDTKGLIVYREYHSYIGRFRKIKKHKR
jgi:hypothetical protein